MRMCYFIGYKKKCLESRDVSLPTKFHKYFPEVLICLGSTYKIYFLYESTSEKY